MPDEHLYFVGAWKKLKKGIKQLIYYYEDYDEEQIKGDVPSMTTTMINQQKFFSNVLPRLFIGTPREVLTELLQNAQRAGATRIDFAFPDATTCTVSDNGHGLLGGIDDLRNLLILADSHYEDERVEENQAPMGMGLYALIANKGISGLTIESNGVQLEIDTRRWLHDVTYLESWEERVRYAQGQSQLPVSAAVLDQVEQLSLSDALTPAFQTGFRLQITGSEDLIENLRLALLCGNPVYTYSIRERFKEDHNPITGYQDLLDIFLDGHALRIEGGIDLPHAEIVATYQGNEARISLFEQGIGGLVVNWYGQLIFDWRPHTFYQVYLIVRTGQPVNPQAPTRTQLVQDEQLAALYAWVENQLFAWARTWEDWQELPSPLLVEQLYKINSMRAMAECPLAVVQQYKSLAADYQFYSSEEYVEPHSGESRAVELLAESDYLAPKQSVRKRDLDQLLILQEHVLCAIPAGHPAQSEGYVKSKVRTGELLPEVMFPRSFEIGITSLLRAMGLVAYRAGDGIPDERINALWWRPGTPVDRYHTTTLGEWGLQQFPSPKGVKGFADLAACVPLIAWQPLLTGDVFVADEAMYNSMELVDWIIGVARTEQMPAFLAQYANAAFVHDEDDWEESQEAYDESVKRIIRTYRTNMIDAETAARYLPHEVAPFLDDQHRIKEAAWRFIYREHENPEMLQVTALALTWADGYELRITLDY